MKRSLSIHWRNLLLPLIAVGVTALALRLGLRSWILGALLLLLALAAFLPRIAAARRRRLDRELVRWAAKGDGARLQRSFRRAVLARGLSPRWYRLGTEGWICMASGQDAKALTLLREAVTVAPEPQRSSYLANLATLEERSGDPAQAQRIRSHIARRRPDLAAYLDEAAESQPRDPATSDPRP